MPPQTCENEFIVEYIARHSLMPADGGWTWKFDGAAMGARRFGEPFREYLQAARCRAALLFGENSALVPRHTASYMSSLMGSEAPIVEMPEAQHHVMLDQPLAFVAALRMQATVRYDIGCCVGFSWRRCDISPKSTIQSPEGRICRIGFLGNLVRLSPR